MTERAVESLTRYASLRSALQAARLAGDFTFYAPNFDIYVRVISYPEGEGDPEAFHLVAGRSETGWPFWVWQPMREARG